MKKAIKESLLILCENEWIQQNYFASDVKGNTIGNYGVCIFSKIKPKSFEIVSLPSRMERKFLVCELIINNETVRQ